MVEVVKIKLWGKDMGALSWDKAKNFGSFEYYPEFLKSNLDVSPIHMPLQSSFNTIYNFPNLNQETYRGLPGLLSDVLPDDFGNLLIDQWLDMNRINKADFTPIDRLSYIGKRGMGAMEFEPTNRKHTNTSTPLEVSKLVQLAQGIINEREQFSLNLHGKEDLNELIKVGTSAGGQRPKAIIAFNSKTREVRSGQTAKVPKGFEHYLFKFDGVANSQLGDPMGFGRIEYAYYLMAIDCGIEMEKSELFEENGRAHFMTKRFDRVGDNEKRHMQTLCSLAHFDFRKAGAYSYEHAFETMRTLRLPHTDAVQLFKRMVFNVVARNQDDHTKNISFLMDKNGVWRLSPAYDITYSYNPQGIWTNYHQMAINGKRDNFEWDDLLEVGSKISYKQAREAITEIVEVVKQWEKYAAKAGVLPKQISALQKTFRLHF
jgi:serine/threonine-protein kinase HipA